MQKFKLRVGITSVLKTIKSYFKKIEFWIDCYIVYLLYNERKHYRYNAYMMKKWKDKFK
jgi:hypothetical protein